MKHLILIGLCLFFFVNCKQNAKTETIEIETTIARKIANAHGFENWKYVSKIEFTFAEKRSWTWRPKTNDVTLRTETDTIIYNRKVLDSTSLKADQAFINDKFWLLIPFQLVWDKSVSITESGKTTSPISKTVLNKITITYPNEGGYTPGDAYDIFYDNNYIIKEWTFRRGNQQEPSLSNTFENYQDFKGIKIALDHKKATGDWNLKFSEVSVTL
ncbi:hypothetical protein [Flavisericum labens]|uniref:hypothetical protein n=1 Tax=Flavisericum labens TaxID=3377112 RepID=UPI00387B5582